jgi:hypothetical protein
LNSEKRPKLKIPLTWKDRTLILIATVPIVFVIIYLKINWNSIPEIIPTHFNFSGVPDSFGSKKSLFIIIGISTGMHVFMSILAKVPGCYNYPVSITEKNAEILYKIGRKIMILIDLEMSYMMSMLAWENIQTAMGRMYGVSSGVLFVIIGVMFVTIIYGIIRMIKVQG